MAESGAPETDARVDRKTLLILFVAALAIRVAYTWFRDVGNPIPPGTDAISYNAFAEAITQGTGWILHPWPALFRPPGYPLTLAGLYVVTGHNLALVQLLQSIAGAATVVLVYVFGCRHVGRRGALLAALWLCVNPLHLDFNGKLLREVWLVLLNVGLVASLAARDGLRATGIWRTALLYTVITHFDSRYLFHFPFFAVYFALTAVPDRRVFEPRRWFTIPRAIRPTLLFALAVVLFSTPWAIRNALAYDEFVLIDPRVLARWGKSAQTNVAGDATTEAEFLARFEARKRAELDTVSLEELDAYQAGVRPKFGQPHKAIFNFMEFWRIAHFRSEYRPFPDARFASPWSTEHNIASLAFMGLLLPLFLAGSWRILATADRAGLLMLAFIGVHMMLHIVVHSVTRYRLPVEPFYGLIAFGEAHRWWTGWRRKQ